MEVNFNTEDSAFCLALPNATLLVNKRPVRQREDWAAGVDATEMEHSFRCTPCETNPSDLSKDIQETTHSAQQRPLPSCQPGQHGQYHRVVSRIFQSSHQHAAVRLPSGVFPKFSSYHDRF